MVLLAKSILRLTRSEMSFSTAVSGAATPAGFGAIAEMEGGGGVDAGAALGVWKGLPLSSAEVDDSRSCCNTLNCSSICAICSWRFESNHNLHNAKKCIITHCIITLQKSSMLANQATPLCSVDRLWRRPETSSNIMKKRVNELDSTYIVYIQIKLALQKRVRGTLSLT